MPWPKLTIRGVTYEFGHLAPFVLSVPSQNPGTIFKVRIAFGCHVFTRSLEEGDHEDFHYMDGRIPRCFCPTRHACSRFLRGIMRDVVRKSVFLSQLGNFYVIRRLPALVDPYTVFFDVRKGGRRVDAKVNVVSAHERGHLPKRPKTMPFSEVVQRIVVGEAREQKK